MDHLLVKPIPLLNKLITIARWGREGYQVDNKKKANTLVRWGDAKKLSSQESSSSSFKDDRPIIRRQQGRKKKSQEVLPDWRQVHPSADTTGRALGANQDWEPIATFEERTPKELVKPKKMEEIDKRKGAQRSCIAVADPARRRTSHRHGGIGPVLLRSYNSLLTIDLFRIEPHR
ncbi:hypothetical protein L7F22_059008 [Adiantum nelumboides]|nr:hypothetical protein [Adiantum nelumboides]